MSSSMTDEELDRNWVPNGRRPQSTIARTFSQELQDIFRIENSVADLDDQVTKRKLQITSQASELEALEARIREMEQRLKSGNGDQPASASNIQPNSRAVRAPGSGAANAPLPVPKDAKQGGSRPGTARQNQPSQLPPTPVASEDGDEEHDA